jgi:catechol 2,3-dioxygenase-like lactoylglutathione lyase family enzyme
MTAAFDLVTIDTPDTQRLAEFWCAALGLHESEREDHDRWVVLSSVDGVRRIGLQRGEHRAGGIHLDVSCAPADFHHECDRLIALGAAELQPRRTEHYGSIANLADPDGNLFDLCAYH